MVVSMALLRQSPSFELLFHCPVQRTRFLSPAGLSGLRNHFPSCRWLSLTSPASSSYRRFAFDSLLPSFRRTLELITKFQTYIRTRFRLFVSLITVSYSVYCVFEMSANFIGLHYQVSVQKDIQTRFLSLY